MRALLSRITPSLQFFFLFYETVGCALTLKSVGNPVTQHNRSPTQGAWMKDPLGVMGNDTIFVMQSYYSNDNVEEFENLNKFKAGVVRKTYTLPFKWDGTGAVVYGNHLYYNRFFLPSLLFRFQFFIYSC